MSAATNDTGKYWAPQFNDLSCRQCQGINNMSHDAPRRERTGFLCRMGQSDLLAGVSRGIVITISVLGPAVGAMILWWVVDLGTKLDRIDDRIGKLFQTTSDIQTAAAGAAATASYLGARVDRLEGTVQDHDRRITRLEAVKGVP